MKIALIDDHPIIIEGYKSIIVSKEIAKDENVFLLCSIKDAFDFITRNAAKKNCIDLFVIDYNMPVDFEHNLKNGEELALIIRNFFPNTKIVLLTSMDTPLLLFDIINRLQPEGMWLKSDIGLMSFVKYMSNIISGGVVYSESVNKALKNVRQYSKLIDEYNRKLLLLINEGVKNKNLPNHLHLSLDTINHRKANLKIILGMDSGDDYELIKKAKSLGLL